MEIENLRIHSQLLPNYTRNFGSHNVDFNGILTNFRNLFDLVGKKKNLPSRCYLRANLQFYEFYL